jgi:NAD(P)-dependent dehydrogenase (short-subunit alcohol dehydrogenase family)
MSSQLDGTVCVITGTGGSMGRAPTLASAREAAFVLVDCDRSVDAAHATVELRPGSGGDMPPNTRAISPTRRTARRSSTWRSAVSAGST